MSKYWDRIAEIAQKQTKKGLSKYGNGLEENVCMDVLERIKMIEEELVDALMYLEHLKSGIGDNEILTKIQKQIDFEEKWLNDVMNKDGKVSSIDISTAMDGIRFVVKNLMRGMDYLEHLKESVKVKK